MDPTIPITKRTRQLGREEWIGLVLSFVLVFIVGWLGSQFTQVSDGSWYATLSKPVWNPPGWVFGFVWTVLYIAMAIAAWLVWKSGTWEQVFKALTLYGFQLALNLLWSAIFFGLKNPGTGLIELGVLWITALMTLFAFWKRDRRAGALFLPYNGWLTFAFALNFMVWRLNP